jgi:Fe-S-cluster containining protein
VVGAIAALDQAERDGSEVHPIIFDLSEFPYDVTESGTCSKLQGDICTVYATRPLVCNTGAMYEKYWKQVMTEKEYIVQSKMTCLKLHQRENKNGQ